VEKNLYYQFFVVVAVVENPLACVTANFAWQRGSIFEKKSLLVEITEKPKGMDKGTCDVGSGV